MTILHLCLFFMGRFNWEDISNTRDSVSSAIQTPRISSKILRCASYFQLSSRCLDMLMKHCISCLIYYVSNLLIINQRTTITITTEVTLFYKWNLEDLDLVSPFWYYICDIKCCMPIPRKLFKKWKFSPFIWSKQARFLLSSLKVKFP